jgi:reactive intermediate/imine deaminase
MRYTMPAAFLLLLGAAMPAAADDGIRFVPAAKTSPFSAATQVGDVLYLSGQIGVAADGTIPAGMEAQARQTMDNIAAVLKAEGRSMDDVFKCTVMLTDMSRWAEFNKIYVSYFKPERLPARSAMGVAGLVATAVMEVECMAHAPTGRAKPR